MSEDSERIRRAIASFNNQITRITQIKDAFSVGGKVREQLEDEIQKLIGDRDRLQRTLSRPTETQVITDKVGIKENVVAVLGRANIIDESPDSEVIRILKKLEKNTISKKMTFFISLGASIVGLVIGIAIGYVLP